MVKWQWNNIIIDDLESVSLVSITSFLKRLDSIMGFLGSSDDSTDIFSLCQVLARYRWIDLLLLRVATISVSDTTTCFKTSDVSHDFRCWDSTIRGDIRYSVVGNAHKPKNSLKLSSSMGKN